MGALTVNRKLLWSQVIGLAGVAALSACSGDAVGPHPTSATRAYWRLTLDEHAINLALTPSYNTVRLTAAAYNANGAPLSLTGTVRYQDTDSSVTVDSTGLVTAHYISSLTKIVASLTVQGVMLSDTAFLKVTQTPFPAPLATFSIQPRPDGIDSAKYAVDGQYWSDSVFDPSPSNHLPVYATIATGNPATDTVCNSNGCQLLVYYSSSDSTIASFDDYGDFQPRYPGHVVFYARTLVYGVVKQDSLPFVIGYPISNSAGTEVAIGFRATGHGGQSVIFTPATLTIGVGGTVLFQNKSLTPVDIEFSDSADVSDLFESGLTGNIRQACDTCSDFGGRTFPVAGTYTYSSKLFGSSGTIIVSPGP